MIKLTLNPDFHPSTSTFHKKSVTIGSSKSPEVDLAIPDDQLQNIHVKIVEQDGRFLVINQANDPFVSLNDRPFGKKEIKTGDQLSIRDDIILFEGKVSEVFMEPSEDAESWQDDILTHINMNELVKDIEKLEKKAPLEGKKPWRPEKPPAPKIEKGRRQKIITAASFLFALLILIAGGVYLTMSEQIDAEEIKAAEGVADVAIALTYAKLNRETPQKMDWSDPSFLNRILSSIIPNQHPKAPTIGSNGQFKDWPFIVRIYSSGDLSHFLVIAQPVPSLLHWFLPQKTILLDSSTMELRMTKNVKDLNRLLANMDTFEDGTADEVSALIRKENLIPLSKLVKKGGNKGFAVPKELAKERPGSENLIYNAPRYYSMGEAIVNQAMHLLETQGNSKEVTQLKGQIDFISQLANYVFYSSNGKEGALEGLRALSTISPNKNFLVGYVDLNDNGIVEKTHLVEDQDKYLAMANLPADQIAMHTSQIILESEKTLPLLEIVKEKQVVPIEIDPTVVDYNHPLFLKLKALMNARQQNLERFTEGLLEKLKLHNQFPQKGFLASFQEKLLKYDQENSEQQQKIIQEMVLLNQKFSSIPFAEFLSYVKAAGMVSLLEEYQKQLGSQILSKEEFEDYLVEIKDATQLQDLDKIVSELSTMLTLKNIPDYQSLILFQNAVSYHTLQKLSHFLLTSGNSQMDKRDLILHILKTAWISDPDVVEFFLNEYDLAMTKK